MPIIILILKNPEKFRRRLAISYAKTAVLELSVNILKKSFIY